MDYSKTKFDTIWIRTVLKNGAEVTSGEMMIIEKNQL